MASQGVRVPSDQEPVASWGPMVYGVGGGTGGLGFENARNVTPDGPVAAFSTRPLPPQPPRPPPVLAGRISRRAAILVMTLLASAVSIAAGLAGMVPS